MAAPLTPKGTPLDVRLRRLSSVDERGCWMWIASIGRGGYGRIRLNHRTVPAHRAAYELWVAPIPAGMTVDHLCFNPGCINPAHLRLLTNSENARNQRKAFKTHCAQGHEFTAENTLIKSSGRGRTQRACRVCRTADEQRRYAIRKAAKEAGRAA